ncbi:MAG: ABC transporter ATP-binding protein [Phycisphaeraceae bacterium]|nr:ABC transporter ATP-binding protein [Phycisphaeraceae bacterium]
MSTPPISMAGVMRTFGVHTVFKDLDFTLPAGSVVGLLGRNGSGKTTLLRCALGLLKLDAGRIDTLGEDPWRLSAKAKARIGYVPQTVSLYGWMRVRHLIQYHSAFYPHWNQALVDRLVRMWELPMNQRVKGMSVGQLQQLAIVLAMGHEPELLILDEPVAALDPAARRGFLQAIIDILDQPGHTVLFSTHITADVERVCDRVALLKDGRIELHEELDTLKDRIKRLVITGGALPEPFDVPGLLRIRRHANHADLTIDLKDPSILPMLRQRWEVNVEVVDLNLEDIFLELHDA